MSVGSGLFLDAEALYQALRKGVEGLMAAHAGSTLACHLVGITSGGAWLAQRLHADLRVQTPLGIISSAMHRDDFSKRGLSAGGQTVLSFDISRAHIILLDDVLFTGRTIRAVVNELFDYGRPASVQLAVLVDRGGRELPIHADFAASRVALAPAQSLALARDADGTFSFNVES
jgi:pyrimidine operon attenuation protein / uracil phosphoribosyltransferase